MSEIIFQFLGSLNLLFEAGIAISALSLFIRALSFNLRNRVSQGFAVILACVTFIYSGEALAGAVEGQLELQTLMRIQWIGIILLPSAYLHFADALLETTGRPSRGRRRFVVRLSYFIAAGLLWLLPGEYLVGKLIIEDVPIPYLERTILAAGFSIYYLVVIIAAETLLVRAFRRTSQSVSRRRMGVLLSASIYLAVGSYPFLLVGSDFAATTPVLFLGLAAIGSLFVFFALASMAYAVAFFGLPWPDRIVKKRLLKWFLRGPVTIFVVLTFATLLRDASVFLNFPVTLTLTIVTIFIVLLMEHGITLASSVWEKRLFLDGDRDTIRLLEGIQERLVTRNDVRQYLEAILSAICDQFQVSTAFVAGLDGNEFEVVMHVGDSDLLPRQISAKKLFDQPGEDNGKLNLIPWEDFWLLPLRTQENNDLLGIIGVLKHGEPLEEEQADSLRVLSERSLLALEDLRLQQQMFSALETLSPKVELFQRLRAATRYDQQLLLTDIEARPEPAALSVWVKDALTHFWGGPNLTRSPLLQFKVVQDAIRENDGNYANGMRAILRRAIDMNKPKGERNISAEWILYNILDFKFMQGRKVRDVARRLAVSEADLYRKQRIAIENIAETIIDMEKEVQSEK